MYPRTFAYARPSTVDDVLALLAEYSLDATILAGGCSLIPLMKYRLSSPEVVIDIGGLGDELRFIRSEGSTLRIGALATHSDAATGKEAQVQPLIPRVAARIADVQVRNMGTVVGGVCSLAPISDWVAPILALRGSVLARSQRGEREVQADDFVVGPYQSSLAEDELAVEVRFPVQEPGSGASHQKVTVRANDAVANCCAAISVNGDGAITTAGVAFGSINPAPFRAKRAEELLIGRHPTEEVLEEIATTAFNDIDGFEDAGGDQQFRALVARGLFKKAVRDAYKQANREVKA